MAMQFAKTFIMLLTLPLPIVEKKHEGEKKFQFVVSLLSNRARQ